MTTDTLSKPSRKASNPITTTELVLTVSDPLLLVCIHYKDRADGSLEGILRLRADNTTEWDCNLANGIETKLEPYFQLKKLDPYYDFYIAKCGEIDRVWYELKILQEWRYEPDRVIIPVDRADFVLT
jgi:hypothetical protein